MAGAASQKKQLSDGELSDDDAEEKANLDTSVCKTCNLTFKNTAVSSILFYELL